MATTSEPRPSIFARTLASNLARAGARTDSLTMTPTRRGRNGATQTIGRLPKSANRAPASTVAASTRWGAILTLATRSPFSTTWPSNAVKTSSGSIRLSRSSSAMRTLRTPAASARRSTRLWTGARIVSPGPATAAARRIAASSSCNSPGSGTSIVTGSPASAVASTARSSGLRRRPLDQRCPEMVRSRARIAPTRRAGARFPGVTRWTCTGSRPDDQRSRARAASIARRV